MPDLEEKSARQSNRVELIISKLLFTWGVLSTPIKYVLKIPSLPLPLPFGLSFFILHHL